jgi:hypothetical protein
MLEGSQRLYLDEARPCLGLSSGKIRGHSTGDDMKQLQLIDAVARFAATAGGC